MNLKVLLISDEPLYHSLQGSAFRIWINGTNHSSIQISAADLGLEEDSCGWLVALEKLLAQLKLSPTLEEYQRLAFDIEEQVRNEHQLKVSLFGWLENVDWEQLESEEMLPYLSDVLQAIQQGLDVHEEIEITSL